MAHFIETLGNIIKEELLHSLTEGIVPHTLVLENREAFPGYYHNMPGTAPPHSIFLITKHAHSREEVTRATQAIKKKSGLELDASTGQIHLRHETLSCIRLLSLQAYSIIPQTQLDFESMGFLPAKFEKINSLGLIKVKKFFRFEPVATDTYLDTLQPHTAFFRIPEEVSWDLFVELARQVKNNWTGPVFDAALASAYIGREVHDLVRVYSRELTPETLFAVRDAFIFAISRL